MHTQLLRKISNEMNRGNAVWALYWANEYLERDNPLRHALATKAKSLSTNTEDKLLSRGISGEKLRQLTTQEQAELKTRSFAAHTRRSTAKKNIVISPKRRERGVTRRAVSRERGVQRRTFA